VKFVIEPVGEIPLIHPLVKLIPAPLRPAGRFCSSLLLWGSCRDCLLDWRGCCRARVHGVVDYAEGLCGAL